jgi:hypothetical protein
MFSMVNKVRYGLEVLNSIEVEESGDTDCPYVNVKDTPEVREKLKSIGVSEDHIISVDDGEIDLLMVAIEVGASGYWNGKFGVTLQDLTLFKLKKSLDGSDLEEIRLNAYDLVAIMDEEENVRNKVVDFEKITDRITSLIDQS